MKHCIRICNIDLSFHAASAAVVSQLAIGHGVEVESSSAPHEEAFRQLGSGEVDVLVSAWLPASHSKYLDPIASDVTKLAVLYEPYCIWGVPDYIPQSDVSSVDDLLRPTVESKMDKVIQGINPGAGISRFSAAIVKEFGLDQFGYDFRTGSEEDCFSRVVRGFENRDWFVVPLWHPQYLHHRYHLRAIEEPKGLLGGNDEATLIARTEILQHLPPALVNDWQKLNIGNDDISMLDHRISVDRVEPNEAALAWISNNHLQGTPTCRGFF